MRKLLILIRFANREQPARILFVRMYQAHSTNLGRGSSTRLIPLQIARCAMWSRRSPGRLRELVSPQRRLGGWEGMQKVQL